MSTEPKIKEKPRVPVVRIPQPDGTFKEVSFTVQRAHEYWAAKARKDLAFYMEFMYHYKLADFQREWCNALMYDDRVLIVCAMEHGKTDFVLGAMAWHIGHQPWNSNVIACVSTSQAVERMSSLKQVIEHSDRYKMVFPWIDVDNRKPWSATAMNVVDNRMSYSNYVEKKVRIGGILKMNTCMTTGIGSSNLIGGRISGLGVVDDPHDEKSVRSTKQREKVREWYFGTFISRLMPQAHTVTITTRWAEDDLAGAIMTEGLRRYKTIITPAEYIEPTTGERKPNLPAVWPIERLDAKREEIGERRYRAYYLNNPNAFANSVFQEEWLNNPLPTTLPPMKKIVISVDPNVKASINSDFTAVAAVGQDDTGKGFYLLDMVRRHMLPRDIGDVVSRMYHKMVELHGRCDLVVIEKSGQQVLLVDQIVNMDTLAGIPIRGVAFKGDKEQKAKGLEAICNNGRFYADWKSKGGEILRMELLDFPFGSHDDTVDAVAQAINQLTIGTRNVESTVLEVPPGYFL